MTQSIFRIRMDEDLKRDFSQCRNDDVLLECRQAYQPGGARKMSPDLAFRDPCFLDFLGLHCAYSEKDLERAMVVDMIHESSAMKKMNRGLKQ